MRQRHAALVITCDFTPDHRASGSWMAMLRHRLATFLSAYKILRRSVQMAGGKLCPVSQLELNAERPLSSVSSFSALSSSSSSGASPIAKEVPVGRSKPSSHANILTTSLSAMQTLCVCQDKRVMRQQNRRSRVGGRLGGIRFELSSTL